MTIMNILLPSEVGGAGVKKRGEIDETAPLYQIKEEIISSLMAGKNPEDYDIVHLSKNEKISYSNYTLSDGDTFMILDKRSSRGKAVSLID